MLYKNLATMDNAFHNMSEYIKDDFIISNTKYPSEPSCLATYRQYFAEVEAEAAKLVTFSEQQQIKYRVGFTSKFAQRPQAVLRQVKRGGTVAIFDIIQGPFKMELKMLVIPTIAPKAKQIGGGSFGKICEVQGRKGSVSKRFELAKKEKLIQKQNESSFIQTISPEDVKDAVIQCSLAKICSMLGIGPEYHFVMGFDLILFDDCIEFYMEKCSKYDDRPNELSFEQIEFSLKKRVRALHMICFTHKDIKPPNILYSSTKKELVLCDFGVSKFLSQKLGWRSLTFSEGTKSFMSVEMRSISKRRPGWVDMYYNDMHALKKTIQEISKCPLNHSLQEIPDKYLPSQLEMVAITCCKLTEGAEIQFMPKSNRYSIALSDYFPEFSGNSFESKLVNPMFLVLYADKCSELPYFLQLCDSSNKLVNSLSQNLQKSLMSKMDLFSFKDANSNDLTQQQYQKEKILKRQIDILQKIQIKSTETIIHYAEVNYELLNMKIVRRWQAVACQDIANKLQQLLSRNPNLVALRQITDCARLLLLTTKNASVGKFGNLMQKGTYDEELILRVCGIILARPIFEIGDFKVMQMLLSFVKKNLMPTFGLKAKAYCRLGNIQKAVLFLQQKIKENPEPMGSIWRLWLVYLLIKYLIETDITKAFELCKQQLQTTPIKYRHQIQLLLVDIYQRLGRQQQSQKLLDGVIQAKILHGQNQQLIGQVQAMKARNMFLRGKYEQYTNVLSAVQDKPYNPFALLMEARYNESLGKYGESIRLYEECLYLKQLTQGKESFCSRLGILSTLTSEALSRNDGHRQCHLKYVLAIGKSLFIYMLTKIPKVKIKSYFLVVCLRHIIRCAFEMKLEQQIFVSVNKLNQALHRTLDDSEQYFPGLANQLLIILRQSSGVSLLKTLDIFLEILDTKERKIGRLLTDARRILSICYLVSNQHDRAMISFNPLLDPQNHKFVAHFNFKNVGYQFFLRKNYKYAINVLNLGVTPEQLRTSFWLALCYFQVGDRANCQSNIFRFLGSSNETEKDKTQYGPSCYSILSKLYMKNKCLSKANSISNINIVQNCGLYLLKQKKYAEALPWLKKTLLLQIKSKIVLTPPIFIDLAVCNIELKNVQKSLKFYKQSFKLPQKPTRKQFLYLIGLCCEQLGFRTLYRHALYFQQKSVLRFLLRLMKQKRLYIHWKVLSEAFRCGSQFEETKVIKKESNVAEKINISESMKEIITLKKTKLNYLRLNKKDAQMQKMLSQVNQSLKELNRL